MSKTGALKLLSTSRCYGGQLHKFEHVSSVLGGLPAKFSVFLPPTADTRTFPVLFFLSGLTCNEDNFITKAGAVPFAARHNIALICPDTSPRGAGAPGEDDAYDFGTGAGFYVNATTADFKTHYNMYDYINSELYDLVHSEFNTTSKASIFGHSMGGHGALISYLKNPGKYQSASAFSPICNPTQCPWGEKAFMGYLGEDREAWKAYDATELMKSYNGPKKEILIDQGVADNFYPAKQLLPENFQSVCDEVSHPVKIRMQEGYDHSYWFIQSFVEDHIIFHSKAL